MSENKPKLILWVDDNLRESYILPLQKELNIKVNVVSTLSSAIYRLQNTRYDLVITDMSFPRGQQEHEMLKQSIVIPGLWLIRKIREGVFGQESAKIPIAVYTILQAGSLTDMLASNKLSEVYAFSKSNISLKDFLLRVSKLILN